MVPKKKINIPICDVKIDEDYDKNVKPSFKLPSSYIRYVKKLGDEPDITTDYFMDKEDMNWIANNESLRYDKEVQRLLTYDTFECIVDHLERCTGMSKDPISLANAEKSLASVLSNWPSQVRNLILSEIYKYWLSKREKLHKPLVRKYWPLTPYSDTNPYNVFRPRDKEKYRLRRQQKKNDIESFRRFQQLRIEFNSIKSILQLVIEREKLKQAALDTQKAIFEQSLIEIGGDKCGITKSPVVLYRPKHSQPSQGQGKGQGQGQAQSHAQSQPSAKVKAENETEITKKKEPMKLKLTLSRGALNTSSGNNDSSQSNAERGSTGGVTGGSGGGVGGGASLTIKGGAVTSSRLEDEQSQDPLSKKRKLSNI